MSAGTITGASSRGVLVSGGIFNMYGGTITGNSPTAWNCPTPNEGGGVVIFGVGTTFVMHGGTISNNTVSAHGGGVRVRGGASFIMHGGLITGNEQLEYSASFGGGGVSINGSLSEFRMYGGRIYNNTGHYGGGIRVHNGLLYLSAANLRSPPMVHYNTALANGGGVHFNNNPADVAHDPTGIFDGVRILNNHADNDGGGVQIGYAYLVHIKGETIISGNTADRSGGGVNLVHARSNLVMDNGAITNNTAQYDGGGIRIGNPNAAVRINLGMITNNTAHRHGGGIWAINYTNLHTSANTVFSRNRASVAHDHGIANRQSTTPVAGQTVRAAKAVASKILTGQRLVS